MVSRYVINLYARISFFTYSKIKRKNKILLVLDEQETRNELNNNNNINSSKETTRKNIRNKTNLFRATRVKIR